MTHTCASPTSAPFNKGLSLTSASMKEPSNGTNNLLYPNNLHCSGTCTADTPILKKEHPMQLSSRVPLIPSVISEVVFVLPVEA